MYLTNFLASRQPFKLLNLVTVPLRFTEVFDQFQSPLDYEGFLTTGNLQVNHPLDSDTKQQSTSGWLKRTQQLRSNR